LIYGYKVNKVPHPRATPPSFRAVLWEIVLGHCVTICLRKSVSRVNKQVWGVGITYLLRKVTMTSQRRNVYVVGVGMTKVRAVATTLNLNLKTSTNCNIFFW